MKILYKFHISSLVHEDWTTSFNFDVINWIKHGKVSARYFVSEGFTEFYKYICPKWIPTAIMSEAERARLSQGHLTGIKDSIYLYTLALFPETMELPDIQARSDKNKDHKKPDLRG